MPLNFVKVVSAADNGTQNFLGNEPSGDLYQYYVTDQKTSREVHSALEYANYDSMTWSDPPDVCMTPREVQRIGVKNFPQIGSIGFYRLAYLDRSRIMVPLHIKKEKQEQPVLEAAADEDTKTITFTITPPDKVSYDCYRIEMVNGPSVISHITYENTVTVPYPEAAGEYQCFAIGYLKEGQICSKDSNALVLNLSGNSKDVNAKFCSKQELTDAIDSVRVTVDSALNKDSLNPVTNAAVTAAIGDVETLMAEIIGEDS